jgi:hypothetical protein
VAFDFNPLTGEDLDLLDMYHRLPIDAAPSGEISWAFAMANLTSQLVIYAPQTFADQTQVPSIYYLLRGKISTQYKKLHDQYGEECLSQCGNFAH